MSTDDVTIQMRLLAEPEVEDAWAAFVSAWEALQGWVANEYSGDPDEDAPEELMRPANESTARLKELCRASVGLGTTNGKKSIIITQR